MEKWQAVQGFGNGVWRGRRDHPNVTKQRVRSAGAGEPLGGCVQRRAECGVGRPSIDFSKAAGFLQLQPTLPVLQKKKEEKMLTIALALTAFVCPPVEENLPPQQLGDKCGGSCNSFGDCAAGLECYVEPKTSPLSFAILMGPSGKAGYCREAQQVEVDPFTIDETQPTRRKLQLGGGLAGGSSPADAPIHSAGQSSTHRPSSYGGRAVDRPATGGPSVCCCMRCSRATTASATERDLRRSR